MTPQRIAALDLGSNSFLLTIVEADSGDIKILHESCVITQLSKDMDSEGRLSAVSVARSLTAIEGFRHILDEFKVSVLLPVGTAVFRKATDSWRFVNQAEHILDTEIEIISGQREAELSYNSVAQDPIFKGISDLCVVDLGGGSAEIAIVVNGVLTLNSYPVGAMAMKQAFVTHDPILDSEYKAIADRVFHELSEVHMQSMNVVGVGGAFVNFCGSLLRELDLNRIHGMNITSKQLAEITRELCVLTEQERANLPGLEPERAGVIHVSAIIATQLLKSLNASNCLVCVKGLRWGVIYEACHAHRN